MVKNKVKEEKQRSWEKFGQKLEEHSKDNQKLFYRAVKNLRGRKTVDMSTVKNVQGETLTNDADVMRRWREYFQELLFVTDSEENVEENESATETEESKETFTLADITEAIQSLKNGKAPGHDTITSEMLKNMGRNGTEMLLCVCNRAWTDEEIPEDWQRGIILPIYKSGDRRECSNYRGITLLSTALKIYEKMIEKKLKLHIEPTIEEAQSGFRVGRSVHDHIFTVKQIIEKTHLSKTKAYFAFIDLEKAFDRVNRKRMWDILVERGVNKKLIQAIKSIYKRGIHYVNSNNRKSETFESKGGLRQGGALSPTLFNIFIDHIIKESKGHVKELHVGMRKLKPVKIRECAYADDVVIMAGTESALQKNINTWNTILEQNGMRISRGKSKVMLVAKEQGRMNIEIDGHNIEQVTHFKYLGTTIDSGGNQERDIIERADRAIKTYHMLKTGFIRKKEISRRTKMTVYQTVFRPILTYGSETWVLDRKLKSKIQAIEMKYLRTVKGVTRRDRIRNVDIREELKIKPVLKYIEERQLSWWGHLHRMESDRLVKNIWEARVVARRDRGRPKETWDNTIAKILQEKGTTIEAARRLALDRREWRKFVESI